MSEEIYEAVAVFSVPTTKLFLFSPDKSCFHSPLNKFCFNQFDFSSAKLCLSIFFNSTFDLYFQKITVYSIIPTFIFSHRRGCFYSLIRQLLSSICHQLVEHSLYMPKQWPLSYLPPNNIFKFILYVISLLPLFCFGKINNKIR